jgi:hypothetical protein
MIKAMIKSMVRTEAIEAGNVHAIAARYLYQVDQILRSRRAAVKHPRIDLPVEDQKREGALKVAIGRVVRGAAEDPEKQREIHRAGLELAISTLTERIQVEQQVLVDLRRELECLSQ